MFKQQHQPQHLTNRDIAEAALLSTPPDYDKLTKMICAGKVVIDGGLLLLCFSRDEAKAMERLEWLWGFGERRVILAEFWYNDRMQTNMVMHCITAKDIKFSLWASRHEFLRANLLSASDMQRLYLTAAKTHQSAEVLAWWKTKGAALLGYQLTAKGSFMPLLKACPYCGTIVRKRGLSRLSRACLPDYFCQNCWNGANASRRKSN